MPKLSVQHCILNRATRQYGPHPTSDLLGVDYFVSVPPDTEFPRSVSGLEVFVRFLAVDIGPRWVRIDVWWLDHNGNDRELVLQQNVSLQNDACEGAVILPRGFKLHNLLLPGEGEYVIRILRPVKRKWERHLGWRVLAEDYFWVSRSL